MNHEKIMLETKEKRQHSSTLLPYSTYECRIPEYFINVPMHWHPEFELNLVKKGTAEFVFNDEKYIVQAGDVLILPPNILHAVYPIGDNELAYDALVFNKSMLGTESNDRSATECILPLVNGTSKITILLPRDLPDHSLFEECAQKIFHCAKMNQPHYDLLLRSHLQHFFFLLEESGKLIQHEAKSTGYSSVIRPTLEYMNEHYAENITIEQLAEQLHLSKSYFMWCFKKAVGIGAIEYLTQLRLREARNLLISSAISISEIAYQCGYGNLSNFNRQFKKLVGCTPNEYRKKLIS